MEINAVRNRMKRTLWETFIFIYFNPMNNKIGYFLCSISISLVLSYTFETRFYPSLFLSPCVSLSLSNTTSIIVNDFTKCGYSILFRLIAPSHFIIANAEMYTNTYINSLVKCDKSYYFLFDMDPCKINPLHYYMATITKTNIRNIDAYDNDDSFEWAYSSTLAHIHRHRFGSSKQQHRRIYILLSNLFGIGVEGDGRSLPTIINCRITKTTANNNL